MVVCAPALPFFPRNCDETTRLSTNWTVAIIQDEEDAAVPDDAKAIFYAAAELSVRYPHLGSEIFHELTDHGTLGRADPPRLTPRTGKVSTQARHQQSTPGPHLRSPG